jgi:hypothetical protein
MGDVSEQTQLAQSAPQQQLAESTEGDKQ